MKKALIGEPIVARFMRGPTSGIIMTGNYSVTPETFVLGPPTGQVWKMHTLTVYIQDTGNFNVASYGNGITLTDGISIRLFSGETEIANFMTDAPVKTNAGWARLCFNVEYLSFGTGDNAFVARWQLRPSDYIFMHGLGLDPHPDVADQFRITLSDDFSGLTDHTVLLEGSIVEPDRGTV